MTVTSTTTAASRRALTTVERYRETMPETDALNAKLETLIGQASAAIETYLGRKLARERVTELLVEEAGTRILLLERRPIVTVHGITLDGQALDAELWNVDNPAGGMIRLVGYGSNDIWDDLVGDQGAGDYGYRGGRPQELKIEVDYTGGYIVPGQTFDGDDTPTLPLEIEVACQVAVQGFLEAQVRPAGLTSEKLGDASWSYAQAAIGRGFVSDDVKALLATHRLPVI